MGALQNSTSLDEDLEGISMIVNPDQPLAKGGLKSLEIRENHLSPSESGEAKVCQRGCHRTKKLEALAKRQSVPVLEAYDQGTKKQGR